MSAPVITRAVPAARRRRYIAVTMVAVAALAITACDSVFTETASYISWTEQQRDRAGAPRAQWSSHLAECADNWAAHLAANGGALVHADLGNCMPSGATRIGENLAEGSNPFLALQAILDSPVHVRNMDDPAWRRFGVGHAVMHNGTVILVWRFAN